MQEYLQTDPEPSPALKENIARYRQALEEGTLTVEQDVEKSRRPELADISPEEWDREVDAFAEDLPGDPPPIESLTRESFYSEDV